MHACISGGGGGGSGYAIELATGAAAGVGARAEAVLWPCDGRAGAGALSCAAQSLFSLLCAPVCGIYLHMRLLGCLDVPVLS